MHLNIRYKKNRKISDAIHERVIHKLERIEKMLEEDHPVHMTLSSEKDGEHAELGFHYHGHDVIAKSVCDNLFESIDNSTEHAGRQLDRIRKKLKIRKGDPSIKNLEEKEISNG